MDDSNVVFPNGEVKGRGDRYAGAAERPHVAPVPGAGVCPRAPDAIRAGTARIVRAKEEDLGVRVQVLLLQSLR
jgi:hypothetical protein